LLFTLVFCLHGSMALQAWKSGWAKIPNTGVCDQHALTQLIELRPLIFHQKDWEYGMRVFEEKSGPFFADGPRTAWQCHDMKRSLASQGLVAFQCMRNECTRPAENGMPSTEAVNGYEEDYNFCSQWCEAAFLQDPRRRRRA